MAPADSQDCKGSPHAHVAVHGVITALLRQVY
eukprot:COSAG01_NODE_66034_length_271_cov_0.901163_1_plen_31_part_10